MLDGIGTSPIRNVDAFDEDSRDVAQFIADRLVREVENELCHRSPSSGQSQRDVTSYKWFASVVYLVQQSDESLIHDFRQRFGNRPPNETAPAGERVFWTPSPGKHEIVVADDAGRKARRVVEVRSQQR